MKNSEMGPMITLRAFEDHTKNIISDPYIAIVELISNSWDAGAEKVEITWPSEPNEEFIIKDNGEGMAESKFREIWPTLGYNRIKDRGREVEYKINRKAIREAYGKNGKGRHAPFCFSNDYEIETIKNGICTSAKVKKNKKTGFKIAPIKTNKSKKENGTTIKFNLNQNFRDEESVRKEVGSIFLTDPEFEIFINNKKIELIDLGDNVNEINCEIDSNNMVKILKTESIKITRNTNFHGVTWISGKRRIKNTKWKGILDGRSPSAKKYAFIVHADILKDELSDNGTDFKKSEKVENIVAKINDCIIESTHNIIKEERSIVKKNIATNYISDIKQLSNVEKDDIGSFITKVQKECSSIGVENLDKTSKIVIDMIKEKRGFDLLHKIASMNPEEIDNWNEILEKWDIGEIKIVLSLIHERINFLNVLEKKMNDSKIKEKELQFLFEKGLWAFGYYYESAQFTSDKALATVVRTFFEKKGINLENPGKRPDFVVLPNSSIGLYSLKEGTSDDGPSEVERLLIIELKRGGSKITIKERNQAEGYATELLNGKHITEKTKVDVYVLGTEIKVRGNDIKGTDISIIPMHYHKILSNAEKRLLNLRKIIKESKGISDEITDEDIKEVVSQKKLDNYSK